MSNVPQNIESPSGKLTTKQNQFIDAYVANGGNGSAAARDAGYAESSAHVEANRALKNPLIVQEIFRRTTLAIGAALPKALNTVVRLSESAKSEYVQLEASRDLLDRAGMKAPERIDHRLDGEFRVTIDLG
jgi:phage terminase small subunit